MGSAFWVNNPTVPIKQIDVSIVMDLVGSDLWDGFEGHFVVGAETSKEVTAAVEAATKPAGLKAYRIGLHMPEITPLGRQPWSDYAAFFQSKVPVLFLTNGQNKRYHTPQDETAHLNLPKMALEAQYLLSITRQLGDTPTSTYAAPTFDAAGTDYLRDVQSGLAVLKAALSPGGLAEKLTGLSKAKLIEDLKQMQAIEKRLTGGAKPNNAELGAMRKSTQRLMCYAGSTYVESTCNIVL